MSKAGAYRKREKSETARSAKKDAGGSSKKKVMPVQAGWGLLTIVCLGVLFGAALIWRHEDLIILMERLREKGALGAAVFVLLYIASCVMLLPVSILTPAMGFIYGFYQGAILVSIGTTSGAVAAFIVGRYLLRDRVEHWIEANPRAMRLTEAIKAEGWKVVLLSRMCVFVPFRLSNYAFSTTRISLPVYAAATFLGTIPSVSFYVYTGSLAGSLAELDGSGSGINWYFHGPAVSLGITILVLASRFAQRTLREAGEEKQ